jgi:hypothetical protein
VSPAFAGLAWGDLGQQGMPLASLAEAGD